MRWAKWELGLLLLAISQAAELSAGEPVLATVVFAPRRSAVLSAEIAGRVVKLPKEFGQSVAEGELLVELDTELFAGEVAKAEATVTMAQASLDSAQKLFTAEAGPRKAEAELKFAQANLAALEKLSAQRVRQQQAEAEIKVARQVLETTERLSQDKISSSLDLEKARKDVVVAEANLQLLVNGQAIELASARKSVAQAQADFELAGFTRLSDLETAKRDLAVSQANLAAAKHNLAACRLTAPFPGRLAKVEVHEHELVAPGKTLLELVNDTVLRAQFLVPSRLYGQIKLGREVRIKVIETGGEATGRVSNLSAQIDPASESFTVYAEVDNAGGGLRAGMRGTLDLTGLAEAAP